MTFDGTSGENCLAKRDRSNTPLQALTLLNDEMYVGCPGSRQTVHQSSKDPVYELFRRFLTRPPSEEETKALQGYLEQQIAALRKVSSNQSMLPLILKPMLPGQAKFCSPGLL